MFLRSDNREQWDKLDSSLSKKLGKHYIGLIKRNDLPKVQSIFMSKLDAIRNELKERLTPSLTILKGAASSAVKPREVGKKLKRNLSKLIKEDTRSIKDRFKDKDKEDLDRDNGTTEDEVAEEIKEPVMEEPVEEVPEEAVAVLSG